MGDGGGSPWIAAVAAVVGVAVGAVGTYAGNQAILSKQVEREERLQKAEARGVARVFSEQLKAAAEVLDSGLQQARWPGRNDLHLFTLPTTEERRLVQARLSARAADAVSKADEAMLDAATTIEVEPGRPLTVNGRTAMEREAQRLAYGVKALPELEL
jgi:hypothetical protein